MDEKDKRIAKLEAENLRLRRQVWRMEWWLSQSVDNMLQDYKAHPARQEMIGPYLTTFSYAGIDSYEKIKDRLHKEDAALKAAEGEQ
jgi:hypothetical protein